MFTFTPTVLHLTLVTSLYCLLYYWNSKWVLLGGRGLSSDAHGSSRHLHRYNQLFFVCSRYNRLILTAAKLLSATTKVDLLSNTQFHFTLLLFLRAHSSATCILYPLQPPACPVRLIQGSAGAKTPPRCLLLHSAKQQTSPLPACFPVVGRVAALLPVSADVPLADQAPLGTNESVFHLVRHRQEVMSASRWLAARPLLVEGSKQTGERPLMETLAW